MLSGMCCITVRPPPFYRIGNKRRYDEPGTETLSITADPRSDGLVKARTGDTTDATTYTNWYKTVYIPAEEEE